MNAAGNILTILLLTVMLVQDFRSRSISAWLLPAVAGTLLLAASGSGELQELLYPNLTINGMLLLLQFFVLWVIISLRKRAWTNIINTQIGTGDLLLLICIAPFFSPLNYFLLFTSTIVLALIISLVMKMVRQNVSDQIPFAGIMGFPLILLCVVRLALPDAVHFTSTAWFNQFIS